MTVEEREELYEKVVQDLKELKALHTQLMVDLHAVMAKAEKINEDWLKSVSE